MIALDDSKWKDMKAGYRVPYDASVALRRLERGEDVWDELWQNLHHQGDVGEASYSSVPHLVRIAEVSSTRDWNFYGLVSAIEVERHRKTNPPLPVWLNDTYTTAWRRVLALGLTDLETTDDPLTVRSILGALALAKGELKLGTFISRMDTSEIDEILEEYLLWSQIYG